MFISYLPIPAHQQFVPSILAIDYMMQYANARLFFISVGDLSPYNVTIIFCNLPLTFYLIPDLAVLDIIYLWLDPDSTRSQKSILWYDL